MNSPNGEKAYRVECYGLLEGAEVCQRKAQEICNQQPVRVLQGMEPYATGDAKGQDTRELTFRCGDPSVAASVAPPITQTATPATPAIVARKLALSGDATFDFNQSALTSAGRDRLDKLVNEEAGSNFGTVTVNGYTDGVGSAAYNLGLSERRARTVVAYLKDRGLHATRFVARGYGRSNPVASNATTEGRSRNRRVEITFDS
ncbi:OmpA family protein [Burkholderia sp. Z1]|uniref:OmpA family protein n=1 Tax=Burkholderia sp. Z1 TaxID=2759039 RepID=UPI001D02261A|nr:OmpA family protein [Burkholderia sp. Z1]